jgi:hypothetical protein
MRESSVNRFRNSGDIAAGMGAGAKRPRGRIQQLRPAAASRDRFGARGLAPRAAPDALSPSVSSRRLRNMENVCDEIA